MIDLYKMLKIKAFSMIYTAAFDPIFRRSSNEDDQLIIFVSYLLYVFGTPSPECLTWLH